MDTKRLLSALALGVGLLLIYYTLVLPYLDKRMQSSAPQQTNNAPAPTPPTSAPTTAASTLPATTTASTNPATSPTITAALPSTQVVAATQPMMNPAPAVLGSAQFKDSQFALQLRLLPLGAGVEGVILNEFKATAQGKMPKLPYEFETPLPDRLDTQPLGSRSITVDGTTYDLSGVQWSLIAATPLSATYGADLVRGETKLLSLTKTYTIASRSDSNLGFEIGVEYGFSNLTADPHTVHFVFNGPTLPPPEGSRGPDRQVVAGYIIDKDRVGTQLHPLEEFKPEKDNGQIDLTKDKDGHPARWAGAVSTYFGSIVLPLEMSVNGSATNDASYIAGIVAQGVDIDKSVEVDNRKAYLTFTTSDLKLTPHGSIKLPVAVFLGPKWREKLDSAYYSAYPRQYNLLAVIVSSMCGLSCSFSWLAAPISWLLWVLDHWIFRDWGLAIIGLVAIVRVILHPITRRSQISMQKMQKMGPEMKRLQEKYKDDKDALNKAMMEFHREQGFGPFLGCLPMFLQMPIWIALYGVLQSTFELRQAPFFYGWTWIHDLSQPDYLIHFTHAFTLPFGITMHGFNLVPVLLAAAMAAQSQFMPKPVAATPEQIQQQRMMQWLSPVMFLFFFYGLPSGLNLYIFTSTAVGVMESKIIRDHLKQREEAEKAGRVFVETKPTRNKRGSAAPSGGNTPNSPGTGGGLMERLGRFWGKLLEQAEQARKEQDKQKKKK